MSEFGFLLMISSFWSVLLFENGQVVEVSARFRCAVSFAEAAVTLSGLYGSAVIGLRCKTFLWWPEGTKEVEIDNATIQL